MLQESNSPRGKAQQKMRNNKWNTAELKKKTRSKNSTFAKTIQKKQFYNEFKELVTVTNYFLQNCWRGKRSICQNS
jgi:hypothetical protein